MGIETRVLMTTIRTAVDEALRQARQEEVDGAGWEDLVCQRAEKYIDDKGQSGYRCFIADVSGDADELKDYVIAFVFGKMGVSVEVITEW